MKVHTFADGQVIVLSSQESMTLNEILNIYLTGRENKFATELAESTYCAAL
jgi:hypothetical protein